MRRASPDPRQGVFETILVLDGRPVELDAHLRRLGASLTALYGLSLPGEAAELASRQAAELDRGRLRLRAAPASRGTSAVEPAAVCVATAEPVAATDFRPHLRRGVALRSRLLRGGLGAHKWQDRSSLPAVGEGETALLTDTGGQVLEAAWANLFAVLDGRLATPPLDGRILPGVTRAAAIELARGEGVAVDERPLRLADLHVAEEVFLTASIRGLVPAGSLDGRPLGADGQVGHRLAALLRARWRMPQGEPTAASV